MKSYRQIRNAVALACGLLAAPLYAENAEVPAENEAMMYAELNPVVVTGTRTQQRLKDTPVPVEVVTAREIAKAGITNVQDALTMMVPSLSFSPNAMGSYLRMNGLSNRHVIILLNGKKMTGDISGNVDVSQIDMNTVKRIEVLNGASSTLYGSDAVGGVINIITEEPTDDASFSSTSKYSRENQFDQGLKLSLRSGKVGSLTSYAYQHSDGWQNSHYTEDGDELVETLAQLSLGFTSHNFSQKFTFDPTSKLSLYAEGAYYNRLLDRPVTRKDITGGKNYNTFSESASWGAGGKYLLGNLGAVTFDYSGRTYGQWYKYMVETGDYMPGDYFKTKRQDYHSAQLQGALNLVENGSTVVGADYVRETLDRPDADLNKSVNTVSLYAQHEQRFLNCLTAIVGARYDNYVEIGSRFTPKVALMWRHGDFNARATYSMGYRTPGIDELYYHMLKPMGSRHIITFGNQDLKAEESNYWSVNFEYRTRRVAVSVTGYINRVNNMVTSRSTKFSALSAEQQAALIEEFPEINSIKTSTLSVKEYYNFSKANVEGVDVNVTLNPLAGFTLSMNYSLAHGEGLNDDGSWQRLNRSVLHTATLLANYSRQWKDYTLDLTLNGRVQSKTYYPGDADGNAPGYGIWNVNTRHSFNGFRSFGLVLGVGVDNVFNRRDNRPLNKNFALYSPGRSLVVSLGINL